MKKFRVLHLPTNVAGQPYLIAKTLRKLGHKSHFLQITQNPFSYENDFEINLNDNFTDKIKKLVLLIYSLPNYDIYHFHFGRTFFNPKKDLPLLKRLNKKIVGHFWGSEVRQWDIAKKYLYNPAKEMNISESYEDTKRKMIKTFGKYSDLQIVADYELAEYVPNSVYLQQFFDLEALPKKPDTRKPSDKVTIVHSPSNKTIKGTRYIMVAVDKLKREFNNIDFKLLENVNHREAIEVYAQADIVVDQILLGTYGILSIEAMALGKTVICYIRPDLFPKYPNLPIVSANPDNIYFKLKELILSPDLRKQLGEAGREYVKRRHDATEVAKNLIKLYEGLFR